MQYVLLGWSCAALLSLAGCGGGGGGGGSTPTQNVQPVIVDAGPAGVPDLLFTTVTICAPGSTSNCQTIDHIQVDTGSSGLRLIASVVSPTLSLRQQVDAGNNPIVECAQFADGYSWGPVKVADLQIAGERANAMPVQIIGDPGFPAVPTACSSTGPPENTVAEFGANGLIGMSVFAQDCGPACAQFAIPGVYYSCPATGCQPAAVALAQQLPNPVSLFSGDNNGVLIQMPQIAAAGALTASGSLIFGIGTQSNNGLGGATILTVDPNTGYITTVFNGKTYSNSYIDSGSSVVFFGTNAFPRCTGVAQGFYCPATTQSLSATMQGINQTTANVSFTVANVDQLATANPTFNAFNNLAAPAGDNITFAWGLPFFFGRNVYTAIEAKSTPAGLGPYNAF